ncbi:MAG: 4Fe-4S dicluster domain-containing protein [Anaerolineae bacterium]
MATEETAEASAVQVHKGGKSRPARPRGHVTLFGTWCKGCGLCIEFCPQGVFTMDSQGRPVVAFPEKCTACHWCDTHCPDLAITVRRLDPEEVQELAELTELAGQGALPAIQPGRVHNQEGGDR